MMEKEEKASLWLQASNTREATATNYHQ